jgi:uncharacterized protein (TIGR03067 family)
MPGNNHEWFFRGKKFILAKDDKGEIPASLLQALLGPNRKASRIVGEWDLDTDKGQLVLTGLVADGKPGPKEVRLGISTAGLIRVNLEKAEQYNVESFEDKLPFPTPGVTFPIFKYANQIDLEFLQGTWNLSGQEVDGKTSATGSIRGSKLTVKGNTLTLTSQGVTSQATFQLDAVPTPRRLDVTFTDGPEKGNQYLGIYELQEDTLKWCRTSAGKDRPTAFASKVSSGHILDSLQRAAEE